MFGVLQVTDFPLQAVLRLEPARAEVPIALLDEDLRPATVIACTSAARVAGVEIGQTAPQAMARCPAVVLRVRQPAAEDEARASLRGIAWSLSPLVEETAPGWCTVQMDGVARDRREPALRTAVAQLVALGLPATAGLAATPDLASHAARQAAAGRAGEDGVVFIPPGHERTFLRDLPLAVAEPTPELESILHAWGVRTLGDLIALPKGDVTQRLGPAGLALWERAAGESARPLRVIQPPQSFVAKLDLEHEVETLEPLLFVLRRFIDRLALELQAAGFVAGEMQLRLGLADETTYARSFRLPEPTAREEILFRALHAHLETLHTASAVQSVALECQPVRALARQHGLFESALRDPHGFSETLARVAAIVGPDRIGTPTLDNTHRPDAVTLVPPAAVVPPAEEAPVVSRLGPPLRRYRPPLPATVELHGAAPSFVWTAGVKGAVRSAAGPWRGSGEWWDATRTWRREEWDVVLEGGGLYRLLHAPEGWFVEGEYD